MFIVLVLIAEKIWNSNLIRLTFSNNHILLYLFNSTSVKIIFRCFIDWRRFFLTQRIAYKHVKSKKLFDCLLIRLYFHPSQFLAYFCSFDSSTYHLLLNEVMFITSNPALTWAYIINLAPEFIDPLNYFSNLSSWVHE